jgi:uncharacterized membrane protein
MIATTAALIGLAVVSFVVPPLIGWPSVTRVSPILLAAGVVPVLVLRPWKWTDVEWGLLDDWVPSTRLVWLGAGILGGVVFWFVLCRFRSGEINAIDFTVYYDRPSFQTLLGRPLYIESAADPLLAYRSNFAVHAHWVMLPLAGLYLLSATPLWLLALSVVAVVAGAVHTLRIVQYTGGGGLLGATSAFAFVLNDNTARTLNYGFHAEVLYAWFVPWMIHAGLRRRCGSFIAAALACIAVKEDAFLVVFAVAVLLVLAGGNTLKTREWMCLAAPVGLAALNLVLYYRILVPRLSPTRAVFYANYWSNYGPTAAAAAIGMLRRPGQVLLSTMTSGFTTRVLAPHLYLPLVGWRWFVGILPMVLLYGASTNQQLRAFGLYYSIVLVPFLTLGAAAGAQRCAASFTSHRARARACAALAVFAAAVLSGLSTGGYSIRPWKAEIAALPDVIDALAPDQMVLVQSGLYPHAGYDPRIQLLSNNTLNDPRNARAALVLAPRLSAYPLTEADTASLYTLPTITRTPSGLIVVRRNLPN